MRIPRVSRHSESVLCMHAAVIQLDQHDGLGVMTVLDPRSRKVVPHLTGPLVAPQQKQTRARLHLSAMTLKRRVRWMRSILDDLHDIHS